MVSVDSSCAISISIGQMELAKWPAASMCLLSQLFGMSQVVFVSVCYTGNIAQGRASSIAFQLHVCNTVAHMLTKASC